MSPAGGAVYHLRALRFRGRLWTPFAGALAGWLADWAPGAGAVLLVGPSAGYCLADGFLARFRDVRVLEPDPYARWLLRRRLLRLGVGRVEACGDDLLVGGPGGLAAWLAREPARAVVFCNVLGQVRFLMDDEAFARWSRAFRQDLVPALAGRPWVSFHDRLSGRLAPDLRRAPESDRLLGDDELLARFYVRLPETARTYELTDHLTAGLWSAALPRRYFSWEIAPGRFHLIEGVRGHAAPE
jgi:hypothetical protein